MGIAIFVEEAREAANIVDLIADLVTLSVAGCMGAQINHEIKTDANGIKEHPVVIGIPVLHVWSTSTGVGFGGPVCVLWTSCRDEPDTVPAARRHSLQVYSNFCVAWVCVRAVRCR